ncbi:hypothetical protein B0T25DRAFT_610517 [Lasiosphaeria hispida]|uniref:BTB domain-containing protein n=1 Tax=Lasiosphaeria hispida TaxID=260671 RepID=A0AAJ0HF15_9PEZI|nr:hypothetical protein B0T25DRAFT_610517 [Lasiosphaeria hispida]
MSSPDSAKTTPTVNRATSTADWSPSGVSPPTIVSHGGGIAITAPGFGGVEHPNDVPTTAALPPAFKKPRSASTSSDADLSVMNDRLSTITEDTTISEDVGNLLKNEVVGAHVGGLNTKVANCKDTASGASDGASIYETPVVLDTLPEALEIKTESFDVDFAEISDSDAPAVDVASAVKKEAETDEDLPRKATAYHTDADMYIKVCQAEGFALYKVHSDLIAAASPVWRKMVYGGSFPRRGAGKWVVDMLGPEDKAFGLDVIFSIIHYKFHEIPLRPDVSQLCDIAAVVEKYQCAHLLVPYMKEWVTGLNWHIVMSNGNYDGEKTMYLTWVLGEGRWFSRVVGKVACQSTIDDDGNLLNASGQRWKDQQLPDYIINLMATIRMDALNKLIPAIDIPFQELLTAPAENVLKFCKSKDATDDIKEQCQLQQLGSLLSGLTVARLMPLPSPEKYNGSVSELAGKLEKIKVGHFKLPNTKPHSDTHSKCGIHHKQAVADAMPAFVQLSGKIIQQLKTRAEKSGAFSNELFQDLREMEERDPSPEPKEDLVLDGRHFKQVEDFATSQDYYSEGYTANPAIKVEDVDA